MGGAADCYRITSLPQVPVLLKTDKTAGFGAVKIITVQVAGESLTESFMIQQMGESIEFLIRITSIAS